MASAFDNPAFDFTGRVTTSGGQAADTLVKLDTAVTDPTDLAVTAATADTDEVVGVLKDAVASGARNTTRRVQHSGISRVTVDGSGTAIAKGDRLVAGAGGKGVKAAATSITPKNVFGIALAPSTADGDVIQVLLVKLQHVDGGAS